MDCDFCEELAKPVTAGTRIVHDWDGFIAAPTVGAFVDGYLLQLPREHVPSYANLRADRRAIGLETAEVLRGKLTEVFGRYILAEHGAGDACDLGASCIDHAHLHLIPMSHLLEEVREQYWKAGGKPLAVGGQAVFEKVRNDSYVMLSVEPGEYQLWYARNHFQRQFVRRTCAELLGMGSYFNWKAYPFAPRMLRTKLACDAILAENSSCVA